MRYQTRILDRNFVPVKVNPWRKNLVLDQGLNALARATTNGLQTTPAQSFLHCKLGGGTAPNSIASGAITFTQSGNTLTASGNFFSNTNPTNMVGGLFKWGTGGNGAETYITAYISPTQVTVNDAATVSTPDVGTVWQVQRLTLYDTSGIPAGAKNSNTYQTNSGDNGTTYLNNTITFKRTFLFPQQVSQYTVNEIGWSPTNTSPNETFLCGRAVLSSSDVVGTGFYYVVILELTFTYTPGTPVAVIDVGTNINTAGTAMIERWNLRTVDANGGVTSTDTNLDQTLESIALPTATYSQQSTIQQSSNVTWGSRLQVQTNVAWTYGGTVGKMTATAVGSLSALGQTIYGVGGYSANNSRVSFDVKFTTPFVIAVSSFQPTITLTAFYTRLLIN